MSTIRNLSASVALVLACAGMATAEPAVGDPTLVTIEAGAVRGVATGRVISFKAIPYAEPPVGPLRWRPPQPAKPWQGERAAAQFGSSCMQAQLENVSEDCLTLNVWRPRAPSAKPLPVMVWIHGGVLVRGGTSIYPADALAPQGVIVVSMNYRLGRLGFFAHPALATEAPADPRGNYGLMDQRAALQWVQRNIAAFGGDPQQVTIFGEAAGGGSVLVHLTQPLSRGLFHRAILQSPSIPTARAKVAPLTELDEAEKTAVDYGRSVGATTLADLRALPAARLVEGASAPEVIAALSAGTPVLGVAGTIRDGQLVVEAPEAALAAGHQAMVPVMIGATDRDLALGTAESKDALFARFGARADQARTLYDPKGTQTLDELTQQAFADATMVEPARHLADEMARAGQPAWWYRFSYVAQSRRVTTKGALHGTEIPYTLGIPAVLVGDKVSMLDKAMGQAASAYWTGFAKSGTPNGGGQLPWPPYDPAVDKVLNFTNLGVVLAPDPIKARLDLWAEVRGRP